MKKLIIVFGLVLLSGYLMAQSIVQVTNSVNTIEFTFDNGAKTIASKRGAKVIEPVIGNPIIFLDKGKQEYSLDFNLITSPVAANKSALTTIIQNYLD